MESDHRKPGRAERTARDDRTRHTPATDMQPDDAGTAESGKEPAPQRQGTAAEKAMKQASKTPAESGERRR
ncbi:hypothetical protein PE066_16140 [Ramlibacter tataouinensis]|uniref:hypothetical protein n=1 Tax=Ramlibacter tataouinensis TaxID=94132 RepID=UPI0022F3C50B|nr:hypothetical protein [Ramlibacter tataouinensis]WBY00982.1 hypothetical protein PE066_16140 [Ramlibacter tataouinensis]